MDRLSRIELTNMCLIYDDKRVLVQEKQGLKEKYKGGLVFPGGHVETDESLLDSVIREMREETGLTIHNPQPCGFKDWILGRYRNRRDHCKRRTRHCFCYRKA